jgi:hypothetical protein
MDLDFVHLSNSVIKELAEICMKSKLCMGDIDHRSRGNARGVTGVSGAVRETAG